MCGIAGVLNVDGRPADPRIVAAMRDALAHRGPDDEGLYVDREVGLGHRRLSIIDLSRAANQPMLSPDGRIAIVFNGEIYNFRELRRDLERLGWAFRTRSDTEVLIAGYAIWGIRDLARPHRRHGGICAVGCRRAAPAPACATVSASSRSISGGAAVAGVRLGNQGLSRASRFCGARQQVRVARIFHFPEPVSLAHPVRRRRATAAGDHPVDRRGRRAARDLLGLRFLPSRAGRSRSAPSRRWNG